MIDMTSEAARQLREPFPHSVVGKLPRVTCPDCRDKKCQQHRRSRCDTCGNVITTAHIHLDYVGHAEVTDRLLTVDPAWTWKPMCTDDTGAPVADVHGGIWIWLTVADVTRPGYGHADGKRGGDAVKEAIGDALRNAAMRFGVGLDLWRRTEGTSGHPNDETTAYQLRTEIADIATAKGYDLSAVEADFTKAMNSADIRTAGVAVLAEYRDRLRDYRNADAE